MAQKLDLKIKGLYKNPNVFSDVPAGALSVAKDVVIERDSIVETRRGQNFYKNQLAQVPDKIFNFINNRILRTVDGKMLHDNGNVWTEYNGLYPSIDKKTKAQSLEVNRNFYFTSTTGIKKLDSITSDITFAGAVRALDGLGVVIGSSGFLNNNKSVAYRIVWGYKDKNQNLILGAPSSRIVITNDSGGSRNVSIDFIIPDGVTTNWFYQLYRSQIVDIGIEPNDEMQLSQEIYVTSAQVTAEKVITTDNTPDSLKGATLYTSPSQQGILETNDQPPAALDIEVYKDHVFFANTYSKQKLTLNLISVDSNNINSFGTRLFSCAITSGSSIVNDFSTTVGLRVGMGVFIPVDTPAFPSGTVIVSIDSATQITVSNNSTVTAPTASISFGDRISIAGVDYFASVSGFVNPLPPNFFPIETLLTPSENIQDSALSLINVINTSAANTSVYAYYLSGFNDLSGKILLESRVLGEKEFALSSTFGVSFSPALPNRKRITAISTGLLVSSITSVAHGLTTNDFVYIYNSNSTPKVDGTFKVTVSSVNVFSIVSPVSVAGTTAFFSLNQNAVVTENNSRPNVIAISKNSQPESVPLLSSLIVGSANFPIKRILTNRDSLFVFKDDGIFLINGEDRSNFRVQLLDNTAIMLGPETAVTVNNQIFIFTTQGVCSVSETGVQILSKPVEGELLALTGQENGFGENFFEERAFAVGLESRRSYVLYLPSFGTDGQATQQFTYNFFTNCWTQWSTKRSCGVSSNLTNVLYSGNIDNSFVYKEREDNSIISNPLKLYADEQFEIVIDNVSGNVLTVANATGLQNGNTIQQGSLEAVILDVNSNVLTISDATIFSLGGATVYRQIEPEVEFVPIDIENPTVLKQFREAILIFKNRAMYNVSFKCRSNFYVTSNNEPLFVNTFLTVDGEKPFLTFPWRAAPFDKTQKQSWDNDVAIRTFITAESQRALWIAVNISTKQAFTYFQLQGISIVFNTMESRFK